MIPRTGSGIGVEGLLERAWRALERIEHATPIRPLYSVLHCATANPQATPSMLVIQIATETGVQIDETQAEAILAEARRMFAQLVADEISETLENQNQWMSDKGNQDVGLRKSNLLASWRSNDAESGICFNE